MLNQHINRQALAVFLNAPYTSFQDCGISGRDSQINDKKEAIIRGKAIISNIALWKSCPKYFVLFFH